MFVLCCVVQVEISEYFMMACKPSCDPLQNLNYKSAALPLARFCLGTFVCVSLHSDAPMLCCVFVSCRLMAALALACLDTRAVLCTRANCNG